MVIKQAKISEFTINGNNEGDRLVLPKLFFISVEVMLKKFRVFFGGFN